MKVDGAQFDRDQHNLFTVDLFDHVVAGPHVKLEDIFGLSKEVCCREAGSGKHVEKTHPILKI